MPEMYSTSDLAGIFLGDEAIETNKKAATRTTRRFLRDTLGEGKAVVGKGGRYNLPYTKREVTALKKKFDTWKAADEEAKAQRAEALAATRKGKDADEAIILPADNEIDDEALAENEASDAGPSDDEIAAMMIEFNAEDDTELIEDDEV